MKSKFLTAALAAAAVAGSVAAVSTPASAEIACNRYNECWRVPNRYVYPPRARIIFHDDAWRRAHMRGWHWRADHDGRGYYRNGVWITF
jgi:hypothetical protein